MLDFILSPAKKLAAQDDCPKMALETPAFIEQAAQLVEKMRAFAPQDFSPHDWGPRSLMHNLSLT